MLAFDKETDLIWRPVVAPKPVCIQWCDRPPAHELDAELELYDRDLVRELISRPGEEYVGHAVAFDFMVIMAADPEMIEHVFGLYQDGRVHDTLLRQKLLDIARGELKFRKSRGYALDVVGARHGVEVDKDDPWRLKYAQLRGVPIRDWPQDADHYCRRDATAPHRVFTSQQEECVAWELQYGSPILHQSGARSRYALVLELARAHGVRTDRERVELLERVTVAEIQKMKEELYAEGLVRKNGSKDTKAAKARVEEVFRDKGLECPMTTDKRKKVDEDEELEDYVPGVSTEKDTMILSGDETLILYSEYTTATNLLNRVNDLKKGVRLPLQPRYDSLLETGRTSSSKGTRKKESKPGQIEGVQIQNFPRAMSRRMMEVLLELGLAKLKGRDKKGRPIIKTFVGARECARPEPGNVFILCDYEAAELHALGQVHYNLFERSALCDILNSGADIHLMVGINSYSLGEETYTDAHKKLKKEEPYAGWRQAAKPITFGRPGGMGAEKIVITARKSYEVIMTVDEAQRTIDSYEAIVPELPEYFDYIDGLLPRGERNRKKRRGLMRQMYSGRWRGGATFCQMANSYFQGLTADGALDALWQVVAECYADPESALYGFRPVAFVHDEIVLEGPEERAHAAVMRLQHVMEHCMNEYTPNCPTPAEPIITRVWSKSAEAVWKDGVLVPWDIPSLAA